MLLVSSLELLAGLGVDVVSNDDGVLLGSWSRPIRITPGVLCSGVLAKPSSKDGLEIGAVSLFFDDAYYVETAASGVLDEVERSASSLRPTGVGVSLFETVRASEGRFLLALGPLSFKEAQRVRWSLLETGATARVSLGEDFVQPGLPLQR
jgi:hypothetical protein